MLIHSVTLHQIEMKLKTPFTTSYGTTSNREFILVELRDQDGMSGWGECAAFSSPWYTEETIQTAKHMLEDFLIPMIFEEEINHPEQLPDLFQSIKRNNMAKAAIDEAVWDLYAKQQNISLASLLGGTEHKIAVGAAIGIQTTEEKWIETIEQSLRDGYKRIKVKIKPGLEDIILAPIRAHFPELPLMADANSAYTLTDIHTLKKLDAYNLMMIEQPLASDDILDHAVLQKQLQTPICLDESITSYIDAKQAIAQKSCQIINLKISRVGGISEAKRIHDLCAQNDIPVWCGGMLDSGIGRAHHIALSSLSNFVMPGDISASSRYWDHDIIHPEVIMHDGFIKVPTKPGIGYEIDRKQLENVTLARRSFENG